MTVADNTSRNQYTATSGQTVFAYTFEIVDKSHIVVLKNGVTLSEGTDYTVSNVGNNSGGNVTLTVGATTGDILTLYRDMPYSRTQNYTNSGDFLASEVNSDFDNLWLAGEQTDRSFSQSIRKPITDSDSISMELPAAADRADKLLGFDSNGAPSASLVTGDAQTIADIAGDIKTLAEIQDGTVATDAITNVNAIRSNVTTVAGIASNVTTVANNTSNINAVAADLTSDNNIETVADAIANVSTVGNNIANVNTVAGISSDVTTVATNVTDVTNFADVYQGGKASDPTTRNDGSALQAGDLYFNTTNDELRVYSGSVWQAIKAGTLNVQNFTGDGSDTTFVLSSDPGTENNTQIYIDGVYQQKDTYSLSGLTITFSEAPPNLSDIEVVVISNVSLGVTDANLVSYTPAGTGAVETTVQTKLRESVSVKDFGAVGDGVTDDTATLKAAFDYAIPLAKTVLFPSGTYKITGPIQPYATRTSGSIHIFADGLVQIVVDASSTAFTDVLYLETTNFNSCSITGGIFEIDGNDKAGRGITFRHNDGSGGDVNITAEVKIKNIKENDASATRENQALSVYGDYGKINIENVYIEGVQRTNAAGVTKGLVVSQFGGDCSIENVFVKDVLLPSATDTDADGIAVFGKSGASTYNKRGGVAYVSNCVFEDCQGRAFKSQSSEITVMRPRVKRRDYVGMTNSVDFDFQTGGHALLVEPLYEYFENGGVSPLGSSHACVAFQQLTDNTENVAKSIGGTIVTQVQIPRYALGVYVSTAKESYLEVSNLTVMPVDGFTSAAFDRAIIEFDGGDIESKTEKSEFVARNIRGPLGVSPIAYTGYSSGSVASKLSLTVTDCFNTHSTVRQVFDNLSGSEIAELETFTIFNNRECASIMNSGFTFDFSDLAPGNQFVVDIATINATNAPSWGSSGYAMIETLTTAFGGGFTFIRVTTDSNKSFFTWYPAGGWNSSPQKSSASFTPTNVTTDRAFDANSTTVAELADVLGTLISDLESANILS